MKAVMKTKPEPGVEVRDIKVPRIESNEVLIKVKAAAICGSDLGIYDYTPAYSRMRLPVVLGHEFAGIVAEKGARVEGFKAGDRVLAESVKACGSCSYCHAGMSNLCDDSTLFGINVNGGFAEYVTVPFKLLHRIPEKMTFEEAAVVEPLSNTVHFAREIAETRPGDFVVVQGCGPIGLFSAQLFRLSGASVLVTGLGIDAERFKIAQKLGFETFNVEKEELIEKVRQITNGRGADVAFVAVGAPSALIQAIEFIKKRGKIVIVGIFGKSVELPITEIVRREIIVKGAYDARHANFPQSIKLIEKGTINTKDIITHRFPLERAEEAFNVAKSKAGGKVLFIP